MTHGPVPTTAEGVRRANRELDAQLLAIADSLDEDVQPVGTAVLDPTAEDDWSAFQVLAHMSEVSSFFAGHLRTWKADPTATVGRTVEHEGRRAAVARARVKGLTATDLAEELRVSFAHLEAALELLGDADIQATTSNVKYGAEPLSAFLDRYVLGHKAAHVNQINVLLETGS